MGNPNQSKYDYLLSQNKNYMDLTALSTINGSVSYLQLHENIEKYEKLLISKGVRPGDRIGVCALNTPESVYLLYALDKIGAIVIGFSPLDNAEKIQKDIKLTKPKMVITVDLQYKNFKNSEKALEFTTMLYTISDYIEDKKLKTLLKISNILKGNFALNKKRLLLSECYNELKNIEIEKQDYYDGKLTDIMFTGGSSGVHKGVSLAGNGLNSVIEGMRYMYPEDFFTGNTYLGNIPIGHMVYGRAIMHIALTNNMNFALTLKATPKDFYDELIRTNAFAAVGGPPHWNSLLELENGALVPRHDLKKGSLANLSLATSGGEAKTKITEDMVNRALEYCGSKVKLGDGLGATEGWSVILLNSGKYLEPYKIGRPIDTLNVKIIDENTGKEVTKGNKGLLCISGPSVMLEYYENKIETSKVMFKDKEGNTWVNTGDIVRETESGNYEYVGRKKRNFVSGIENIYPEQIEDLLTTLPEINEVVVTCVPNDLVQYLPIYHISLNNSDIDLTTLEKKINSLVEKKLGVNWLPCKIDFSFTFLKRMTNSKLDVTYYQSIDNEEYQKNHNSYDNSVNVRLRKM